MAKMSISFAHGALLYRISEFTPNTAVSSHSPEQVWTFRLIFLCWPSDKLVTSPRCTLPPFTLGYLGQTPAPLLDPECRVSH